ncbi:MAG TPA: 30S ribosomal protein S2, partial [Methyloceanibacter sp.]|nr:30S ribosomal protein S2 [Methyloceanibacter sp.]
PIVAVVDSNCDPEGISHPIPGNDDAGRAITLYCDMIARAAIDGIERAQGSAGVDLGAAEAPPSEAALKDQDGEDAEQQKSDGERRPRRKQGRSEGRGGNGKTPSQPKRPPRGSKGGAASTTEDSRGEG